MEQPIRDILTAYIISTNGDGILLTTDKDKAEKVFIKAQNKNIHVKKVQLTTSTDRLKSLGRNCIVRKMPEEAKKDPINFRNKLIREWHESCPKLSETARLNMENAWLRISKKYNIEDCKYDEFSQWLLDYNEYIFRKPDASTSKVS